MSTRKAGNTRKKSGSRVSRGGTKDVHIKEGDLSTLAGRVTAARKTVGLTQAELARQLNISRSAVCRIEKGGSVELRASTLIALQDVTHHRARWITDGEGPRLVDSNIDSVAARREIFKLSPDQIRDALVEAADKFSKADTRLMIDALLDRLHSN